MNIKEFTESHDENNIIDPNVKKALGTQRNSRNVNPNQQREKRVVTPQQMGFTHEEVKPVRPEQPILDDMEKAILRKQREAALFSQAIEESGEEGISEEEFQDLLIQAKDELNTDDYIPTEDELEDNNTKVRNESSLPKENPATYLEDELNAELMQDEADYANENNDEEYYEDEEEVVESSSYKEEQNNILINNENTNQVQNDTNITQSVNNPFKDFVSGDINFAEEEEDLEENVDEKSEADKDQEEQLNKLRTLIRKKIRPVSDAFDISTFSISKRPASSVAISTPRDNGEKIVDWVLMSSEKPIYMRRFSGTEIERLATGGKGRTRLNKALDMWQLIYNHIVDPNKPENLEDWAKTTSFLDIDHIYMAIYRANFEGANYIPYNCINNSCKEVILTDDFDIMNMCKFAKKEDKDKFYSILGSETNSTQKLYSTEVVPVSDNYAFVFREPSIYNIIFESAVLDQEFVDKFGDLITICTYIDGIYYINKAERTLQPVRTNIYPNNMKKTVKSRIINYSKIISGLNSDQYNTLLAYMQKINESGDSLTYQLPEVTCPHCGTVIPAKKQEAQDMVFTRHQLAALATL